MDYTLFSLNVFPGSPIGILPGCTLPLSQGSDRFHRIVRVIKTRRPTFVCLQEVYGAGLREAFHEKLRAEYVFNPCDLRDSEHVRRRVVQSLLMALFMIIFPVSMAWWVLLFSVWCLFEILSAGSDWFFQTHSGLVTLVRRDVCSSVLQRDVVFQEQGGDWLNFFKPRLFTVVSVNDSITIINTHLNASGPDKHRAAQAREIDSFIKNTNTQRFFLCGDMNESRPDSAVMKALTNDGDRLALTSTDPLFPTWCSVNPYARSSVFNWGCQWNVNLDWVITDISKSHTCQTVGTSGDVCGFISDHIGLFVSA